MNKKIICALFGGAALGFAIYKLISKAGKRLVQNDEELFYPMTRKDPHAWGEYTL